MTPIKYVRSFDDASYNFPTLTQAGFGTFFGITWPSIFTTVSIWMDIGQVMIMDPVDTIDDGDNTDGSGSTGDGTSATGTFGSTLSTYFEDLGDLFVPTVTLPHFNFHSNVPIVSDICNLMNKIGNSFFDFWEFIFGLLFNAIKQVFYSAGDLADNVKGALEDSFEDVVGWAGNAVKIEHGSEYYEISNTLQEVITIIDEEVPGLNLSSFKLRRSRIMPYAWITNSNFKVPKDYSVKLFGNATGISFDTEHLPYLGIPGFLAIRDIKIPGSEYWGFDLSDATEKERDYRYSGNGVTFGELAGDGSEASAYGLFLYAISKVVGPQALLRIIQKLRGTIKRYPTNQDLLDHMGTSYQSSTDFTVVGNTLFEDIEERPTDVVLATDSRLDSASEAKAQIQKAYKRLYTLNKMRARHTDDLTTFATIMTGIVDGDIDSMTTLIDALFGDTIPDISRRDDEMLNYITGYINETYEYLLDPSHTRRPDSLSASELYAGTFTP
jgi:hypothetical protein